MRRPLGVQERVRDASPPTREGLLELGLVVDLVREREVDSGLERGDDRGRDRLEAMLEVERRQGRLEDGRQDVAVAGEPRQLPPVTTTRAWAT